MKTGRSGNILTGFEMRKMNKKEKVILAILYAVFALMIYPVFAGVFFFGNRIPFFEGLKLSLPLPYFVIFLLSLPVSGLFVFLTVLFSKKKMSDKESWILSGIFGALSVPLYFGSFKIAKEIAFHLPWDVMVVAGSARNVAAGKALGYEYYYSIYTNNIPIVYILAKILKKADLYGYGPNPEYLWIQILCILLTLSVLFTALSVKRLTKNRAASLLSFLAGSVLIGLSAWKTAPYTDAFGALFPILCLYFYICFHQSKNTVLKIIFLVLSVLSGGIGGLIKPNLFLVFIAVILTEIADIIIRGKKEILYSVLALVLMVGILAGTGRIRNFMADSMGLIMAPNLEASAAEFFYMGLNEETTGAYNSGDAAVYGEFQDREKSERSGVVFGRAMERIKEKGMFGLASFAFRKMCMTFSDGTFGWYNEVWIDSFYDPSAETNTAPGNLLRRIYRFEDSARFALSTLLQVFWFVILTGIVFIPCAFLTGRREKTEDVTLLVLTVVLFLGIFSYQLLFEARARYLFVFLPVIICISMTGFHNLSLLRKKEEGRQ